MTDVLRSIVYVSSATLPLTDEAVEKLLVEARRLNLGSGVTGVLLFCEGNFMQCFEGTPAAVDETYGRIRVSRQHHGIIELVDQAVATRSFAGWEMGCARATASELLTLSTQNWCRVAAAAGDAAAGPNDGLELLKGFWGRAR